MWRPRASMCVRVCLRARVPVPVRSVPLVNGRRAHRALLCCCQAAGWAGDVVIGEYGRAHRLERPIGGVPPVRGGGVREHFNIQWVMHSKWKQTEECARKT